MTTPRWMRLEAVWSWLPAFRAVGETEHLPSASELLHVSPSALSRSTRLLEEQLGCALFRRVGRRLQLTGAGHTLLVAVRDAMRRLDDAIVELSGEVFRGPLQIASSGATTTLSVIPALRRLRALHPEIVPIVTTCSALELPVRLKSGELDLAFTDGPIEDSELACSFLGGMSRGIYCGLEHPIMRRENVTVAVVSEYEFVGPIPDERGRVVDGWPLELPRRVGMHVDQLRVGAEVCARSDYLALLPDGLVHAASSPVRELHRLPVEAATPVPVYAVHRSARGEHDRPDLAALAEVRASLHDLRGFVVAPG